MVVVVVAVMAAVIAAAGAVIIIVVAAVKNKHLEIKSFIVYLFFMARWQSAA